MTEGVPACRIGADRRFRKPASVVAPALTLLLGMSPARASEVEIWRADSQAAFLAGELEDVSVDRLGVLRLAQRAEQLAPVAEPFLFSFAGGAGRFVAGTGNSGKVLEIVVDGETANVTELFATEAPEVFAVWIDGNGVVYAGSSPDGKVYRQRPESEVEVLFDPDDKYIWALTGTDDGRLLVATGPEGRLHRVDLATGESELFYDSSDTHVRSLALRADGAVLAGTAGEGLLLEIDEQGSARTLYDAAGPEVLAITPGEDGAFYAAALASEASFVDLTGRRPRQSAGSSGSSGSSESSGSNGGNQGNGNSQRSEVTVQAGAISAGSRSASFTGPRSEVLRIDGSGAVESIWKFDAETVYALSHQRQRLWVATGQEGKLFSYQNDQMVLEKDIDQSQIVGLGTGASGPLFASTNAAGVFGFLGGDAGGLSRRGIVTSKPLDASSVARFGSLRWRGRAAGSAEVALSARSGMSSDPDETWSEWTESVAGREASLADLPSGRYLQWRAELRGGGGDTPEVVAVEVTYRQHNRKPEISRLEALEAGAILVPTNFNPSNQAYEPAHPNRDRIFTVVGDPAQTNRGSTKRLWKMGYRTPALGGRGSEQGRPPLSALVCPRIGVGGGGRERGCRMAGDRGRPEGDVPQFRRDVLPDGLYRFRLEASDRLDNVAGQALVAERVSPAVVVDHSPAPRRPNLSWRRSGHGSRRGRLEPLA